MASVCNSLFVILTCARFGASVRSEKVDITTSAASDVDSLKVLYKHCLTLWVKNLRDVYGDTKELIAKEMKQGSYPVFRRDDGKGHMSVFAIDYYFSLSKASNVKCDFKMTENRGQQHDPFWTVFGSNLDTDVTDAHPHMKEDLAGYTGRPERKWFDLPLTSEDREAVRLALEALYISGMQHKRDRFWINDWVISAECGFSEVNDEGNSEWKWKDCLHTLMSGGQVKFYGHQRAPSGTDIEDRTNNKITMDASELDQASFKEACESVFVSIDERFSGIAPEFCAGTKAFEKDEQRHVIENVGWTEEEGGSTEGGFAGLSDGWTAGGITGVLGKLQNMGQSTEHFYWK